LPDRVWLVTATVSEFADEPSATRNLRDLATKTQVRAVNGVPGGMELGLVSGASAVVFPRGRLVYSVVVYYGGDHTDELHQLAVRQAELVGPAPTSCPISAPLTGIADALPREGDTSFKLVVQARFRYESQIRQDFPGVVSLSVDARNGDVWRGTRGDFTVHRARDYWIGVHVESPLSCPGDPAALRSYNGVPLHFVVG